MEDKRGESAWPPWFIHQGEAFRSGRTRRPLPCVVSALAFVYGLPATGRRLRVSADGHVKAYWRLTSKSSL